MYLKCLGGTFRCHIYIVSTAKLILDNGRFSFSTEKKSHWKERLAVKFVTETLHFAFCHQWIPKLRKHNKREEFSSVCIFFPFQCLVVGTLFVGSQREAKEKCSFCWQLLWRMLTATQNTSLNMFLAGWCVFCCRQQEFANKPWDSPDITIMLAPLFSEGHTTDLLVRFLGSNQALTAVCTDCLCENFYWNPGALANVARHNGTLWVLLGFSREMYTPFV